MTRRSPARCRSWRRARDVGLDTVRRSESQRQGGAVPRHTDETRLPVSMVQCSSRDNLRSACLFLEEGLRPGSIGLLESIDFELLEILQAKLQALGIAGRPGSMGVST